ncbi:DNA polymerase III subunit epsilon [Corynebacterium aurimucosum]|uniref:DNA polymerase III subunit epsilon n=2 Tax=Corynebacterium aurimucosum TaxID=169292 RepID=A0A558IYE6_9CORY|nr:DNA polymerase III subunit epsilon [Corynebacterium aurimucosum]
METTSLNPRTGKIVSIGWVPVNGRTIDLSGAGYIVVRGAQVADDSHVHLLTQNVIDAGEELESAMEQLRQAVQGRALLAHFSALEVGFIEAASRAVFGERPRLSVVDTFALERRHMERMGTYPRGEDLRLPRVRERYGLPRYGSHNALSDALACAELYLAQRGSTRAVTLGDVVQR